MAAESGERFAFVHRETPERHEVLLPAGAAERFADAAVLWNSVEAAEKRKNAQVARAIVLALPADRGITKDDRVELVRTFATEHFVNKGLAVQIDLRVPHGAETEAETTNFHAHLLITTRRLKGEVFSSKKARDLNPQMRSIRGLPVVTEGDYGANCSGIIRTNGLEITGLGSWLIRSPHLWGNISYAPIFLTQTNMAQRFVP